MTTTQRHPVLEEPERIDEIATQRSISLRWPLGECTQHGEVGTLVAELGIHHSKHHKEYSAYLGRVEVYDRHTRRSYGIGAPSWSFERPTERYSAKALREFAVDALMHLRTAASNNDPVVDDVFQIGTSA